MGAKVRRVRTNRMRRTRWDMFDYSLIGLEKLRNSVIQLAIADWKELCKLNLKGNPHGRNYSFSELTQFFLTDCNGLLVDTDLEGAVLLDQLYRIPGAPERNNYTKGS